MSNNKNNSKNNNQNFNQNTNENSNILSFNNLLELIEISKLGKILSENKNEKLDIITIEKLKQVIIGDCKCWICKINGNNNKLGLYHFVEKEKNESINKSKNEQIEEKKEDKPVYTGLTYAELTTNIDGIENTENTGNIKSIKNDENTANTENLLVQQKPVEIPDGFWYQPNMDSIDISKYYYVKKDKYGHVINTYQIKYTSSRQKYLQIGIPRANGRDYSIRTYFVTDVSNFEALRNYEWKVYKDKDQYKVACICDTTRNGNKTGTRTLKAIEVIAIYQKMDWEFIKEKRLDNEWGFGPGHDRIIMKKNGKSKVKVDGKRLSVFTKNGNELMCFGFNLRVAKYVDIVSSKYRRYGKNNSESWSEDGESKGSKGNKESRKNKSKSVENMLKEIREVVE